MTAFLPVLHQDELADVFPEYRIVTTLRSGGQGAVFQAQAPDGEATALKIYSPTTQEARVEREVNALLEIDCPALVKLRGHGRVTVRGSDCLYTEVDFVEGSDLADLGRTMNASELRQLLHDGVLAIEALWAKRIVHRDLKPANILKRADGRFVVIDLGLARHLDEGTLTVAGAWCGTPGYASPEQARARRSLTFRSDLFGLGVVAYLMASGRHPFLGRQELIGRMTPTPVSDLVHLPRELSTLIMGMLARGPLRRPGPCADVLRILDGIGV